MSKLNNSFSIFSIEERTILKQLDSNISIKKQLSEINPEDELSRKLIDSILKKLSQYDKENDVVYSLNDFDTLTEE